MPHHHNPKPPSCHHNLDSTTTPSTSVLASFSVQPCHGTTSLAYCLCLTKRLYNHEHVFTLPSSHATSKHNALYLLVSTAQ